MVGCGNIGILDTTETPTRRLTCTFMHVNRLRLGRLITRRETHARQHAESAGIPPTVHVNAPKGRLRKYADQMPTIADCTDAYADQLRK